MPDVPWGRPAAPGDSAPVPRAHWVEQMSWATPAQVRGHTWSTKCPGQFGLRSEGPRGRPAVPGDWGPGPKALVVDQLLGDLRMSPWSRGVDQLPRGLRPGSESPR